ncbi:SCAN box domain-containing protein [Nephila pilipes]|uniref:SCAN box domain-containing protein n=1 Tax=Nephila pilipes TaxID=299642 RepID=A0A8X6IX18_NEPPI|nr:SCAN box domain-containing protein [Nephila pilipes]
MVRESQQHEVEMIKLELSRGKSNQKNETKKISESSHRIQLTQNLPKYDERPDEMGLYLINFEGRADITQVPKDCIAYLLAVLPPEQFNILAIETLDNANNYDFI